MTTAAIHWHSAGMDHIGPDESWMDAALASRLNGMRYAKRRQEARLGRWTAKAAIALALGMKLEGDAMRGIVVRNAPDGAPEAFVGEGPAGVTIAMTDRADWAVCAVSHDGVAIGCDLELVEPRSPEFVRDYFTPHEQEWVASHPEWDLAANLIWSAKESALKVLRTGLRRDTRTVEVTLAPAPTTGWQPLTVEDVEGGRFAGWWIRHGEFVLTCAVAADVAEPPAPLLAPPPLESATPSHRWMEAPLGDGR